MSEYMVCKNCGKQTLVETGDPQEPCEYCHKPARIKEGPMIQETRTDERQPEEVKQEAQYPDVWEPPHVEEAPLYTGKPDNIRHGIRKWRNRCKACDFFYIHDEQPWCSTKRCPERCPPKLRPQYRPKVEQEGAAPLPDQDATATGEKIGVKRLIARRIGPMPAGEESPASGTGKKTKTKKERKAKETVIERKARIEVEAAYLRGWKECAERFLDASGKRI